jgi:hypothetical protein
MTAIAAGLSGCGWRVETDTQTAPTPSEVVAARNSAAMREQRILEAIGDSGGAPAGRAVLASFGITAAAVHLDALGGVYYAYPDLEPDETSGDDADTYGGTLTQAFRSARDGALATALESEDPDMALLMGSIGLTHAVAMWFAASQNAAAASVDLDAVAERTLPWPGEHAQVGLVPDHTSITHEVLMELAVLHDQARHLYETIAARSEGTDRAVAYARMDVHEARGELLAALSGITDAREPVYAVSTADITGADAQAGTARTMELALVTRYVALTDGAPVEDRVWLLNGAFDAGTAAAALPGFTPDQFPVLPGIEVVATP